MKKRFPIFIQTRLRSSRLPAKCMLAMGHHSVLGYLIQRLRLKFNNIYIATGTEESNDIIEDHVRNARMNVFATVYRGHDTDLINRMCRLAENIKASAFIRVQADNVLVDPWHIEELIDYAEENKLKYASFWCPYGLRAAMLTHSGFFAEYFNVKALEMFGRQRKGDDMLSVECDQKDFIPIQYDTRHVRLTLDCVQDYINVNKVLSLWEYAVVPRAEHIAEFLKSKECESLRESMHNLMIANRKEII